MPKPPDPGARPNPSGKDDHHAFVHFNPARPPGPRTAPKLRKPRWGRRLVFFLGAVAIVGGGYQFYFSRALSEPGTGLEPTVEPVPPPVEDPTPTLTALVQGDEGIGGEPGSTVELGVRARGWRSLPIRDSLVVFEVASGSGVLDPDTVRTDAEGIARTSLRLPDRLGTINVLASLAGADAQATLVVKVHAGLPARLAATDGDGQRAEVGTLLPVRLSVAVSDASGVPVPGAEVRFSVLSGGGMAAPSRARTDSLGIASAFWRLGVEEGSQEVSAAVPTLDRSVRFTATATPRPTASDGNPLPVEAGPVTVRRQDFAIGGDDVCALLGGVVRCRGANALSQRGPTEAAGFVAIVSGISHMCGLSADGEALCWGANGGGQLGDGSRTDRSSPTPVRTQLRFSSLTAGVSHTCGLAGGGVPVCWGQNLNGQLGDGSRTDARFPRAVGGGVSFTQLVAGWNHTCGLTENGNAFCWGLNSNGQLGDGSRLDSLVPKLVRGAIESLALGSAHTCGISADQVLCWGDNRFGQLGDGTTENRSQPVAVVGLPGAATQVVAGAVHTCALVADGSVYCWGQNLHGQLGDGSRTDRSSATLVVGDLLFRSIYAGGALTCGFTREGAQYCWGFNQSGQLGDGTRESRATPTPVSD